MHQQPRVPPRTSSPAASPQTNPSRTNNPREAGGRARAGSSGSWQGRGEPAAMSNLMMSDDRDRHAPGPPAESVKKLDQIVQNFFHKIAVVVLDSRSTTKQSRMSDGKKRTNRWFQLETAEIDDFRDELKTWKLSGSIDNQPPPLIIEVYLDTSKIKESQSLTVVDDDGKRWDALEQLNNCSPTDGSHRNTEVILERWRVELKATGNPPSADFGLILPTIYKKAIAFFRSFYTVTRLMPSWKFISQGASRNLHPALTPRCRLRTSEPRIHPDPLTYPLDGQPDPVTDFVFGDLEVPVGRLSCSVTYRNECNFRIDDSESLLSSRFMGVDENFFQPSLRQRNPQVAEVGSLRERRQRPDLSEAQQQTYGSLSTFHGDGPLGTSPLTALKSVKPPGSTTSSPPASLPRNEVEPPNSLPITSRGPTSRPTMRGDDGTGRRPSISFQPFKAGSLSGSPIPRQVESESPASPHSLQKPPSLTQPRNRTSLTAGMPASLRGGPPPQAAEPPGAGGSSPRPASTSRYSSSFTHRRSRPSLGGTSKAGDDEQGSSGRQSLASSVAQPGSGLLAEAGASSGSLQAEGDDISDFLKVLDSKKTLKSFEQTNRGGSATNKTVAQLSKFHNMRESNNALTDSMTSSVQMQRSSSSSSRQLTSVPGMAAPASVSASSSPSKPHSPHTPHTPAIPSRLSENSVADNNAGSRRGSSRPVRPESTVPEASRESTITQEGTTAIDIPLSPRLGSYQRRSSSVAHQSRPLIDDEGPDLPSGNRSLSLGADDRDPPTISGLLGRQLEQESEQRERSSSSPRPAADLRTAETSVVMNRHDSSDNNPSEDFISGIPSSSPYGRKRYVGMGMGAQRNSRQTPPQSSRGSFTGSLGRGRDDNESLSGEPLMFDLSEVDPQVRRSVDEARSGQASTDRGSYDSRGSSRRW